MSPSPAAPPGTITWIKVDRPFLDLWGVIASSLTLTVVLLVLAVVLGILLGLLLPALRRKSRIGPGLDLLPEGDSERPVT
jgi:hypothetical protein